MTQHPRKPGAHIVMTVMAITVMGLAAGSLHAATVFYDDFQYASGAPTVGTDVSQINGSDSQVGNWTGTIAVGNGNGEGGTETATFPEHAATVSTGDTLLLLDRPNAATALTADFTDAVSLTGATFSFEYLTRRVGGHTKDNVVIGYDSLGNEALHLILSGDAGTTNEKLRIGVVTGNGSTTTWDLPGAADADGDLYSQIFGTDPLPIVEQVISLTLSATGYTINLTTDGTSNWTSSEIAFNQTATNLDHAGFAVVGNAANPGAGGMYLDDVQAAGTVIVVPTPAALPAGLVLLSLAAIKRRR